jgi:hypothetical protein
MGQCAAQASFFDLRDAGGEPCLPERYTVPTEPLSVRSLVDALGGTQRSGQQRALAQAEVHEALSAAYRVAVDLEGEETAAAVLLSMCARAPDFEPPAWLVELWGAYRERLRERFRREDVGRETDYSEGTEG